VCAIAALSACDPGQLFGPAFTPIPISTVASTTTSALTSTRTPLPTSTSTPTPAPRPLVGPKMEYETCYIRYLTLHLFSGGKCLSVNGDISAGYLEKASKIDFSQWSVKLDHAYDGIYAGNGPEALDWVFILSCAETMFVVNFPGSVDVDVSPIMV
jgi:hypothetical protein